MTHLGVRGRRQFVEQQVRGGTTGICRWLGLTTLDPGRSVVRVEDEAPVRVNGAARLPALDEDVYPEPLPALDHQLVYGESQGIAFHTGSSPLHAVHEYAFAERVVDDFHSVTVHFRQPPVRGQTPDEQEDRREDGHDDEECLNGRKETFGYHGRMCNVLPIPLVLSLLGCSGPVDTTDGTSDTDPVDDTGTSLYTAADVPLGGACDLANGFGAFLVAGTPEQTDVSGKVADGVVPFTVLEELVAEGGCAVLRRNNPYCDPACGPADTCDFNGECIPYPVNQDLGTVGISGLARAVSMEPVFPGNTYYDTEAPYAEIVPGAVVSLGMPGGVYGPATMYGVGFEALDVTGAAWNVEAGTDLALTWPAPVDAVVRSEITVEINIDIHGVTPSVLRCAFPDNGSAVIPGAILTELVGVGVTGFPNGTIIRRTVDHAAAGAGCMEFIVSTPRSAQVDVAGHTPCVNDEECPEEQQCNEELQTCE